VCAFATRATRAQDSRLVAVGANRPKCGHKRASRKRGRRGADHLRLLACRPVGHPSYPFLRVLVLVRKMPFLGARLYFPPTVRQPVRVLFRLSLARGLRGSRVLGCHLPKAQRHMHGRYCVRPVVTGWPNTKQRTRCTLRRLVLTPGLVLPARGTHAHSTTTATATASGWHAACRWRRRRPPTLAFGRSA